MVCADAMSRQSSCDWSPVGGSPYCDPWLSDLVILPTALAPHHLNSSPLMCVVWFCHCFLPTSLRTAFPCPLHTIRKHLCSTYWVLSCMDLHKDEWDRPCPLATLPPPMLTSSPLHASPSSTVMLSPQSWDGHPRGGP